MIIGQFGVIIIVMITSFASSFDITYRMRLTFIDTLYDIHIFVVY